MTEDTTIKKYEEAKEANLLLNKTQINGKVKKLAQEISKDYLNKCPIIIGVLNGSFIFLADLVRQLTIDCEIDFVKISSYGYGKETSGKVKMLIRSPPWACESLSSAMIRLKLGGSESITMATASTHKQITVRITQRRLLSVTVTSS